MSSQQRSEFAKFMAQRVLAAAIGVPVVVACDDDDVRRWALSVGAAVSWVCGLDLSHAVTRSVKLLGQLGVSQVAVVHSDLPLLSDITWAFDFSGITLASDLNYDGTNLCCVPSDSDFQFRYGPGSYRRHYLAALSWGQGLRTVRCPELAQDIDEPADFYRFRRTIGTEHRLHSAIPHNQSGHGI